MLELRALIMFSVRKSKRVYSSTWSHCLLHFLQSEKHPGYRKRIKFDEDPSAVEQNNYLTKFVNVSIIKKWLYSAYGIGFNGAASWSFGNDSARNVINFGVDNSSSSHIDNNKDNFLILGEGPTYGINGSYQGKSLVLTFVQQRQNSAWVCITMVIIVFCLLMEKKSLHLKPIMKT